jgi:hypothetical protein
MVSLNEPSPAAPLASGQSPAAPLASGQSPAAPQARRLAPAVSAPLAGRPLA